MLLPDESKPVATMSAPTSEKLEQPLANTEPDDLTLVRRAKEARASGANVNNRRKDGLTALHSAAYRGHLRVLALLVDHGADPEICGYPGAGTHSV